MDPSEIALRDTVDFVRGNVRAHSRILEVGCGNRLASKIQRLEASLIERGRIKAVGLRLVAPRPPTAQGSRAY